MKKLGFLVFAMTLLVANVFAQSAGETRTLHASFHCVMPGFSSSGQNNTDRNGDPAVVFTRNANGGWDFATKCGCGKAIVNGKFSNQSGNLSGNNPQIECTNYFSAEYGTAVITPATCERAGRKTITSAYGKFTTTVSIPRLSGAECETVEYVCTWGEWTTIPATCEEDAKEERVCATCGKVETVIVPNTKLQTVWGEWVEVKAPTCTENGSKTRKDVNGCAEDEVEVIPALGHACGEWVEWLEVRGNAAVRVRTQSCTRCGYECAREEATVSSVALGNLGFHCNNSNGNGRVWVPNYTGSIETFIREGNTTTWNLVSVDEDNKVKVAANGGFETPFVCPTCGRTDWISFSNNNGVFNGNNIQLQHSSRPVRNENVAAATAEVRNSGVTIEHVGVVTSNSTRITVRTQGRADVQVVISRVGCNTIVLNEKGKSNGTFTLNWNLNSGRESASNGSYEIIVSVDGRRELAKPILVNRR
jgi:hypothetical protein